jgi:glycosyltransferase involved in cell wall biosynthesis
VSLARAQPAPAPVDVIGIIVPAYDEERRIGRCLTSIAEAALHRTLGGVPVTVVVVLDRCGDRTGDQATKTANRLAQLHRNRLRTVIVETGHGGVGHSRALGAKVALDTYAGTEPVRIWLATTDADSTVPSDWLAHHMVLRTKGFHAVAGTVRVDSWTDQPSWSAGCYAARYRHGGAERYGHSHVHGANLAFSGAAYEAAGGFAAVATAEDQLLWAALRTGHFPSISTPHAPVRTSSRREGRAPDGFAGYLTRLRPSAPVTRRRLPQHCATDPVLGDVEDGRGQRRR